MAEPTHAQKMTAVRSALAALKPPVTDELEVERYVAAFGALWALMPTSAPPPAEALAPLAFFAETMHSDVSETQAAIDAAVAEWRRLYDVIRTEQAKTPA